MTWPTAGQVSTWRQATRVLGAALAIREYQAERRRAPTDSVDRLTFTSGSVNGKKMIVQVVNSGADLGDDQFDLAVPGGGQGAMQG